ncbi:MAG: hypothetical protein IPL26_23905 [Leptospiraceae bacterium]|nr:hypothetical protein [Leptospiraceae bacterium]
MTTIEAVAVVSKNGILQITLPPNILPGKHRVVVVIEEEITEEEELTEQEKEFFRKELKAMRENPKGGYSWDEAIKDSEVALGRKIRISGRS